MGVCAKIFGYKNQEAVEGNFPDFSGSLVHWTLAGNSSGLVGKCGDVWVSGG